ncbi:MAG TPA: DUF1326 domain-containing protein, partial [Vicinamibacterales bacterium]|nr:DUF1326 domain-containing protein [Vicinamibacterales bacterium]
MKGILAGVGALALAMLPAAVQAGERPSVTGDYVEARTAEVFTGGCIMNSEGETGGREALLAWRVASGSLDGVRLDGLAVVAAVAGDVNLGTHELGGASPSHVRAVVYVDERADRAQREALIALARALSNGLVSDIVEVRAVPVTFAREGSAVRIAAGDARLHVSTRLEHDPSCGATQWFGPLGTVEQASIGLAQLHAYSGRELGIRWRQVERRSAFVG